MFRIIPASAYRDSVAFQRHEPSAMLPKLLSLPG